MYAAKDCSIPGGYGYDINAKVSGFLQDTNVFVKSGVGLWQESIIEKNYCPVGHYDHSADWMRPAEIQA